jgi:hexosaminidase
MFGIVLLSLQISSFIALVYSQTDNDLKVWPLPSNFTTSKISSLTLDQSFVIKIPVLSSDGPLIKNAAERYLKLINVPKSASGLIKSCTVEVKQDAVSDGGVVGADESYDLIVEDTGLCSIKSTNVWGALRALETLTQLFIRTTSTGSQQISCFPVAITGDAPRFAHRGLLIDTSRHYLPVSSILRIIDTLPMAKLNVLHWHTVDAESFPLQCPSAPDLVKGAYSPDLTYSMAELRSVTEYAKQRAVDVVFELDVPGHAASWGAGAPQLLADCLVKYSYNINDFALNPTLEETYSTVRAVLGDIVQATGVSRLHLGGDEVVYGCWKNDSSITSFMTAQGISGDYDQLLMDFVQRVDSETASLGQSEGKRVAVTHWEEVFTASTKAKSTTVFPSDVIFQVWTNSAMMSSLTEAGYRVIASPSNYWYLADAINTWQRMYDYDPSSSLTTTQASLIAGGELAMWGEYVDETNLEATVYPRALAVGERLWSSAAAIGTAEDTVDSASYTDVQGRLKVQRCRMMQRGFQAAPVYTGYCEYQYV